MQLIDLINKLQIIHKKATEDPEYYKMMGEPNVLVAHYETRVIGGLDFEETVFDYTGLGDLDIKFDVDGTVIIDQEDTESKTP